MEESTAKKPTAPQIGINIKGDLVNKILNRLQQIGKSKRVFVKDESVLGIFKGLGFSITHIVITNYRIFGVKATESHGNVVFAKELAENDIQSVTVQAKKSLFNQVSYTLEIKRDGKTSKYATVKSADADNIVKLLEKIKPSESLTSLVDTQKQLAAEEQIERDRIAAEQRRQQAERAAKVRQEQKQAIADAKQLAIDRANSGQCPKCGSNNLQAVHNTAQKGFSNTNACGGCCLFGPIGLLCGLCGSGQKQEQSYRMCLNCGNKF